MIKRTLSNILVPIDFTAYSFNALEVAVRIAIANNSSLTLLHIIDIVSLRATGMLKSIEDNLTLEAINDGCKASLNKLKDAVQNKYKVKADIIVAEGLISDTILMKLEELKSDLMVIGTHGTEPKTFFLGLNAYYLIQHAKCTVLAIPKVRKNYCITKIIFPYQSSPDDDRYHYLNMLLERNDVGLEVSGINTRTGKLNIDVLNDTICYLENKLIEGNIKSIEDLRNIMNGIRYSIEDLKIELIDVNTTNNSNPDDQCCQSDHGYIPVLSICN